MESRNPWEWGWEAAVALGTTGLAVATLLLAIATLWVARKTRDVAAATNREIISAWRPVLLVEGYKTVGDVWISGVHRTREVLNVNLVNYGRGPALDVTGVLDREDAGPPAGSRFVANAVAPGGRTSVAWTHPRGPDEVWEAEGSQPLYVEYGDLIGNGFRTLLSIGYEHPDSWLEWQRVDEV